MNSSCRTIFEVMNASNHRDDYEKKIYHIRTYQRGYRWEIQQIDSLLNDIYINYKKYSRYLSPDFSKGYEYCIQPLVVNLEKEEGNIKTYSVIDGQQRLTSLGLLFCALNSLETSEAVKQDRIQIIYDRDESNADIIHGISDLCVGISEIDISGLSLDDLFHIFDRKVKTENRLLEYERKINAFISDVSKDCNIDKKFMINAYIYMYLYFKIIMKQSNDENSYFAFLECEKSNARDYSQDRLHRLREMYKYYTTVIWYEPLKSACDESVTEEDIFENFNSRKIPLTKSELVKALFMNPDNYVKEGRQDYNSEAIKTRQIMIGIKWDEIERQLHDPEMWHFFPHFESWHSQTRFDAIIDCFVYSEYKRRNTDSSMVKIRNFFEADSLFSFKQLEVWIKNDLSSTKTSSEKARIMKKWWDEICAVFDKYHVFFQPDRNLTRVFHRISLVEWMNKAYFKNVTNGSRIEGYFDQLENNRQLFFRLDKEPNDKKIIALNKLILVLIKKCFESEKISNVYHCDGIHVDKAKCDTIEKMVKALSFDSKNVLIEAFLMIFSLQIFEANAGAISRFSFYQYFLKEETKNIEDWILEHIMARGTSLVEYKSADIDCQIEFIQTVINSEWQEYVKFKFKDVLEEQDIDRIIQRKQKLVTLLENAVKNKDIPLAVFDTLDGYDADYIYPRSENDYAGLVMEFLKDNSMGNLSILTRKENSSVKNSSFDEKKATILQKINSGKFVPVATVNMFTGTYCEKGFSTKMWYPCHRRKYLKAMIEGIERYLDICEG